MTEKDLEIQLLRKELESKNKVIELAQIKVQNAINKIEKIEIERANYKRVEIEWISVKERLPENFVSVFGCIEDAAPFPSVRECYITGNDGCFGFYFPALGEFGKVTHWAEMPEPPKECDTNGSGKNTQEKSE